MTRSSLPWVRTSDGLSHRVALVETLNDFGYTWCGAEFSLMVSFRRGNLAADATDVPMNCLACLALFPVFSLGDL
jgi:hypothetical protein